MIPVHQYSLYIIYILCLISTIFILTSNKNTQVDQFTSPASDCYTNNANPSFNYDKQNRGMRQCEQFGNSGDQLVQNPFDITSNKKCKNDIQSSDIFKNNGVLTNSCQHNVQIYNNVTQSDLFNNNGHMSKPQDYITSSLNNPRLPFGNDLNPKDIIIPKVYNPTINNPPTNKTEYYDPTNNKKDDGSYIDLETYVINGITVNSLIPQLSSLANKASYDLRGMPDVPLSNNLPTPLATKPVI